MENLGKFLLKWGSIAMAVSLAVWVISASLGDSSEPKAPRDAEKYAASYDFSKVTSTADSKEFLIPAGNKPVLVALPADYRVTFSSATANAGELDRLDGSKSIPFGEQTDFGKLGNLPMAVAIKVPKGCIMVASFVHH